MRLEVRTIVLLVSSCLSFERNGRSGDSRSRTRHDRLGEAAQDIFRIPTAISGRARRIAAWQMNG
jgi:hypothetical protein